MEHYKPISPQSYRERETTPEREEPPGSTASTIGPTNRPQTLARKGRTVILIPLPPQVTGLVRPAGAPSLAPFQISGVVLQFPWCLELEVFDFVDERDNVTFHDSSFCGLIVSAQRSSAQAMQCPAFNCLRSLHSYKSSCSAIDLLRDPLNPSQLTPNPLQWLVGPIWMTPRPADHPTETP